MIRHNRNVSESWQRLPWRQFRRNLFRLQKRVYKAVRVGDLRKAKSLQKLILKSTSAQLLAIRQVLQPNSLTQVLSPTIRQRVWQWVTKYALQPAHETNFHLNSYGWKWGFCPQDAQRMLQVYLSEIPGHQTRVIKIDLGKSLEKINPREIWKRLIAPVEIKQGILRCVKTGIRSQCVSVENPELITSLLANIVLRGIEDIGQLVWYGREIVIILQPEDHPQTVLDTIRHFLAKGGIELATEETKLIAATDGFDFITWHFQVQKNGKLRCVPGLKDFQTFRQKVKHIVNNSNYGATIKAQKLSLIVGEWRNYHRHCNMSGARFSLYHIKYRAFQVFNRETKQNRQISKQLINKAFPRVSSSQNSSRIGEEQNFTLSHTPGKSYSHEHRKLGAVNVARPDLNERCEG